MTTIETFTKRITFTIKKLIGIDQDQKNTKKIKKIDIE